MSKKTSIKLHVQVDTDRIVRLPQEVPTGPAEVIVQFDTPSSGARDTKSLLGFFADEPGVVDEAMAYVRMQRQNRMLAPQRG